jgi:putative CocE/NonD family hydrolase
MGGMSSAWNHSVRYDGAFEVGRQLTWAWGQALEDATDPAVKAALLGENVVDWYSALPLRRGLSPLSVAPNFEGYYLDEATESDYSAHWKSIGMNWENFYAQTSDVPMMHVSGWYDIYLRGTIQNWHSLSALKKTPEMMLIGPWTHHGNTLDYAGDVDFGSSAGLKDFDTEIHLRWFDRFLKGRTAAVQPMAVRYFLMGTGDGSRNKDGRLVHGGEWRDSQQWPPNAAEKTSYFLHPDGSLSKAPSSSADSKSTTYRFDPEHPVPTVGGGVSNRLKDGAYDQRERKDMPGSSTPYLPLRSRKDILVLETAPLAEDSVIAGPVGVILYASTSGNDTDFTAKLVDVHPPSAAFPNGFDMNLTDGIVRGRYRDDAKTQKLMTPVRIYKIVVRHFDIANVFKKGYRIRLDVSSSNFPRFDVNPNTGEPLGLSRREITVDNTVYYDSLHRSQMILSVLPN